MGKQAYGVRQVVTSLEETLHSYLEAQYHIRDEDLIKERAALLKEPGVVSQQPFVESTPVYELGKNYKSLDIPLPARNVLDELSKIEPSIGVYQKPYVHQAEALEKFLGEGYDLIVATGTGSGKTESFLMPVIGALSIESEERKTCAQLPGCRALLLYPMNALVSDQLA